MLGGIIDEEYLGHRPLSYDFTKVSKDIGSLNPSKKEIIAGFRSLDYMVNQTYYNPDLWKTNAPPEIVYDIFK